jgi:hypothetical protein
MIENACNKNWKPEERASGKAFLSFTLISQSKIRRNIILRFKVIRHVCNEKESFSENSRRKVP